MGNFIMLVRQKRNLEQDLITIKVHTYPIEKKTKRIIISVFMTIIGNTVKMELTIGRQELKERKIFSQHRLKMFYLYELNGKNELLY